MESFPRWIARIVAASLLFAGVSAWAEAPLIPWQLVAEHPHSTSDFTQGLVWLDGRLFESDGQYGSSRLSEKQLLTGKVIRSTKLAQREFGEGLAWHDGALWQLTWREGVINRYDLNLKPSGGFCIGTELWGATSDGQALIISDGSSNLYWTNPAPFALQRRVTVQDGGTPVLRLNELEWINGSVYANVWMTDRIARIDPGTGAVTGWLDLSELKQRAGISRQREAEGAVLNGIAYRADTDTLLVTGKYWPKLFEIKLSPVSQP